MDYDSDVEVSLMEVEERQVRMSRDLKAQDGSNCEAA